MREQTTKARGAVMGPKAQHGEDKRLHNEFEPAIEILLAHGDREACETLLYDGGYATEPLSLYLPGVPWGQPSGSATVGELDVVGSAWQTVPRTLPPGVRLIGRRSLDGYQAARFALATPWRATPVQLAARARALLGPAAPGASVLIQRPAA